MLFFYVKKNLLKFLIKILIKFKYYFKKMEKLN